VSEELTELEATQLCILIHNQIEMLKIYERKLRLPFMPDTQRHYALTPTYPKPTRQLVISLAESCHQYQAAYWKTTHAKARQ
jgi:hypothetical protein